MLLRLDGEVRVIMKATGAYHLPILMCLKEYGFLVSVVIPYEMKQHRSQDFRRVKTGKKDAITICKWSALIEIFFA